MQQDISSRKSIIRQQVKDIKFTSPYKNEEICRFVIESFTGKKFPKARPSWLKNPLGKRLELDCYNDELKLAIEYNGIQHYQMTSFNSTEHAYRSQVYRDKVKRLLCMKEGVKLLVIPYTVKGEALVDYIIDRLI